MARILTVVFAAAFLAGSIDWLATFEVNLHCYQYTSFRIATFDRVAFEEDEGPPLVYRDGFAIPLRIYFAASILGFFLVPPLASFQAVRGRMSFRRWRRITAVVSGLLLFNVLLPNIIVGERFWTLGAFSLGIAAIPLLILGGLVYWVTGGKAGGAIGASYSLRSASAGSTAAAR